MFEWVHDFSMWITYAIFLISFVVLSTIVALLSRPLIRMWVEKHDNRNEVLDPILGYMGLIFGILIGSLAITSFQNQTLAQDAIEKEASRIASLYRNFSFYPEPKQTELQSSLREYTRFVIEEAFPALRKGVVPVEGNIRVTIIERALGNFEPTSKSQEMFHAGTLANFRDFVEARSTRLFSSEGNIPDFLWVTLIVGWALSLLLLFMFKAPFAMLLTLSVILSSAMATLVCLIALMDHPYRGDIRVSDSAYREVYEHLMLPTK